jgi:CHAT domain-containing protein
LGLTRSFLYAGAWTVMCSLWPVSDESTERLMRAFYGRWAYGKPVEEALQFAQGFLLQDETTRHPFYWAGFIVMRGPR